MDERTAKEITRLRRGIVAIGVEIARVEREGVEPVAERLDDLHELRNTLTEQIEYAQMPQEPLTPEQLESLLRGTKDIKEGRCMSANEASRLIRERHGWPAPEEKPRYYNEGEFAEALNATLRDE